MSAVTQRPPMSQHPLHVLDWQTLLGASKGPVSNRASNATLVSRAVLESTAAFTSTTALASTSLTALAWTGAIDTSFAFDASTCPGPSRVTTAGWPASGGIEASMTVVRPASVAVSSPPASMRSSRAHAVIETELAMNEIAARISTDDQ